MDPLGVSRMKDRCLEISEKCLSCGKVFSLFVDPGDLDRWLNGELIQKAMPYLTVAERELLISKTCGPCFDKMFAED
jgi:hypothetical protein